jgi:putative ATPase
VTLADAEGVRDKQGHVSPRLEDVEAAAQQRILAYDRAGDGHYDTVSAFIKSLRGNDPDAALYWLASMVAAGEDPRFIVRRLIISASEDVGNADPRALQVAVAAAQALDHVGLPEAQYALAQATVWISVSPKSDAVGKAYWAAMSDVLEHGSLPVPNHLRTAGDRRMKHHGIGVGYRNPHEFEGHDVAQQYLPDKLVGRRYYVPTDQGAEARIAEHMAGQEERRASGPAKRNKATGPLVDGMRVAGQVTRVREQARKDIADTEKRDAS